MGHRDEMVANSNPSGVALSDKYEKKQGNALLSGSQALVRLLLNQAERDRESGLNTGGFVSGYRGSPLSGFDQTLWSAGKMLKACGVHFQPAINEDLAATACWGTQQLSLFPSEATVDGVFAMWYGKGPGVDRSGDALKHGNGAGTSPLGGVLVLAADDHTAKSSTFGHQSEQAMVAAFIPVLYPSNVQEYLDLGIHGWAMSRHSGLWVGMKCVSDVVETTSVVDVGAWRVQTTIPEFSSPNENRLHIRWPDVWAEQEPRIIRERLPAALEYCRANNLNRIEFKKTGARIGIVCAGKTYNDVKQAFSLLGINDAEKASEHGLALLKLGMVWPLEPTVVREFAEGLDELFVVEEKRPLIEQQIKDELYADAVAGRLAVRVTGKSVGTGGGEWGTPQSETLLRSDYELTPVEIAVTIAKRLGLNTDSPDMSAVRGCVDALALAVSDPPPAVRKPYFCSGCPHNSSTKVPTGSRAMAGIGCHYMANWMDRNTETYTHMGAEGVPWIAQSVFSRRKHIFANLGDGTYFHSGSLAIRQAIAAKVSMTYKILFNDAVAMTGGQPIEGQLTVDRIARQVAAEGVKRIAIVSDDIEKYAVAGTKFPAEASVHDRGELDTVQQSLAAFEGVSVLIYDQTCASEKRRRRKRGTYPDPAVRVVINPAVCEGCGDCSVKSNCLSVEPLETELGRKRQINQSSCNKDMSCIEGFCPSFVSVKGARLKSERKSSSSPGSASNLDLDDWGTPPMPEAESRQATNVLVNGVGGTGVVTIGALLGMAAHIQGWKSSVLDMAGLAQKGGAVWSHVRLAATDSELTASRIAAGQADVMIGCDLVVSAHPDTLSKLQSGRARGVVNGDVSTTADFVRNGDWNMPEGDLRAKINGAMGAGVSWLNAQTLAVSVFGDAIFANPVMLGYAWQKGWLPLSISAIEEAIRLNGQQVERNLLALRLGRWAAHDMARVDKALKPAGVVVRWLPQRKRRFEDVVALRQAHLHAYQNKRYAEDYVAFVQDVKTACDSIGGSGDFAIEVASNLAKLLSYKDEYEIGRLHSDPEFLASVRGQFDGDLQLEYHLAPPLFSRRNKRGELQKRRYGPWMRHIFAALAKLRFLRGTPFDPFGYTHERRTERTLAVEYRKAVTAVLPFLAVRSAECLELAKLPASIRGYGHVKERTIDPTRARMRELVADITGGSQDTNHTPGYGEYLNNLWA
ncbi:indolepyruvate ferredoxin oxidoreductase family protein [Cupriavidus sp. IDO]|uniref:indolepyruvate ferredoxin oxidoreductase family protein n=1 Tax=Cupriavidus sp. IDO TaxID=1539142 RepID=UPI000689523B|nr:indolepyruvate ferredoxin oxidoreductase family protein [Cupriavidus sp. IDO]KWR77789.1 indolepyruvate ferredoxin oxidoreductase [Cupriavidus sp. IDO]